MMFVVYFILFIWLIRGIFVVTSAKGRHCELERARRFAKLTVDVAPGKKPWETQRIERLRFYKAIKELFPLRHC